MSTPTFEGELFQLLDAEGENAGLIWVSKHGIFAEENMEVLYRDFVESEPEDESQEGFAEWLQQHYPSMGFEAVYVTEITHPDRLNRY